MRNTTIAGFNIRSGQEAKHGCEAQSKPERQLDQRLIDGLLTQASEEGISLGSAITRMAALAAATHRSLSVEEQS
jgi:hypothetical protein